MASSGDSKIENLSRYLFSAPSWPRSLLILLFLAIAIDIPCYVADNNIQWFGILGYFIPCILTFILTKPLVDVFGKIITWNRSGLLVLAVTVIAIIAALLPLMFFMLLKMEGWYPTLFALSLGIVFALRLMVLVAIADYKILHMLPAALLQSIFSAAAGTIYFGYGFLEYTILIHVVFGLGIIAFLRLVDRPLKKNFQISAMEFINAFLAHNTDGSKSLEEFFRKIGEEVYVPQVTLFFRREGKKGIRFTVPNVHPGPMGEIGGGNMPKIIHDSFEDETLVAHGCATHDFNLICGEETYKIVDAIEKTIPDIVYSPSAGRSERTVCESVQVLSQPFGDALLMVSTRYPEKTEDLDYPIGLSIMYEGQKRFNHVAFVDGHNCMVELTNAVLPASKVAYEYMHACSEAGIAAEKVKQTKFLAGASRVKVPFTREEGFGDLGILALVVRTLPEEEENGTEQTTAYILFDGNNMQKGVREKIRAAVLEYVDECELMTTDSHVVNTISGKNPVGLRIPAEEIIPYALQALNAAIDDLSPAECGAATAWCERIAVFGSHRITQLASSVNAMLSLIAPLAAALIILAFLFSIFGYFLVN